jgi:hypothetical protein
MQFLLRCSDYIEERGEAKTDGENPVCLVNSALSAVEHAVRKMSVRLTNRVVGVRASLDERAQLYP